MKDIRKFIFPTIFILSVSLFSWSLIPSSFRTNSLKGEIINDGSLQFPCLPENQIIEFELDYSIPEIINKGESGKISLDIEFINGIKVLEVTSCSAFFETSFTSNNAMVFPGKTMLIPAGITDSNNFQFELVQFEGLDAIDGDIFVSLVIKKNGSDESKKFTFSIIPVNIEIRSFYGIQPKIVKMATLLIFGLATLFTALNRLNWR